MTKCYFTKYPEGGGYFASYVYVDSPEEAHEVVKQRGLGEKVISVGSKAKRPGKSLAGRISKSRVITPGDLHKLTFLAWIAIESGQRSVRQVLGDRGILHQAIHWMADIPLGREKFLEEVRDLERDIPGYRPGDEI